METKNDHTKLEKNLEFVNYWIDKADTKISVFLGIVPLLSAVMNYLTSMYGKRNNDSYLLCVIHDTLSFLLIIVSIGFLISALIPKLGSNGIPKEKRYPLFYGDICKLELDKYKSTISKANDNDYADELLNEIHYNSDVCYRKMIKFRIGVIISVISFLFDVLFLIVTRFFL